MGFLDTLCESLERVWSTTRCSFKNPEYNPSQTELLVAALPLSNKSHKFLQRERALLGAQRLRQASKGCCSCSYATAKCMSFLIFAREENP